MTEKSSRQTEVPGESALTLTDEQIEFAKVLGALLATEWRRQQEAAGSNEALAQKEWGEYNQE